MEVTQIEPIETSQIPQQSPRAINRGPFTEKRHVLQVAIAILICIIAGIGWAYFNQYISISGGFIPTVVVLIYIVVVMDLLDVLVPYKMNHRFKVGYGLIIGSIVFIIFFAKDAAINDEVTDINDDTAELILQARNLDYGECVVKSPEGIEDINSSIVTGHMPFCHPDADPFFAYTHPAVKGFLVSVDMTADEAAEFITAVAEEGLPPFLTNPEEYALCSHMLKKIVCQQLVILCDRSCEFVQMCYSICDELRNNAACISILGQIRALLFDNSDDSVSEIAKLALSTFFPDEESTELFLAIFFDIYECTDWEPGTSSALFVGPEERICSDTVFYDPDFIAAQNEKGMEGNCTAQNAEYMVTPIISTQEIVQRIYFVPLIFACLGSILGFLVGHAIIWRSFFGSVDKTDNLALPWMQFFIYWIFVVFMGGLFVLLLLTMRNLVEMNRFTLAAISLLLLYVLLLWMSGMSVGYSDHVKMISQDIHSVRNELKDGFVYHTIYNWRTKFDVDGEYEFLRRTGAEIVEVGSQLYVLFRSGHELESYQTLSYALIISINCILSPLLLLHPSPFVWRDTLKCVDILLDTAYMFLLYKSVFIDQEIDNGIEIVFGLLLPIFRLGSGVNFIHKRIIASISKESLKFRNKKKKESIFSIRAKLLMSLFVVGSALSLAITTMYRIYHQDAVCMDTVGKDLWGAVTQKYLFSDSFFGEMDCNFDRITTLNLEHQELQELASTISYFTNLEILKIGYNDIETLPKEILHLDHLQEIDSVGNPVDTRLVWQDLGLKSFPNVLLLLKSLRYLDLSQNSMENLGTGNDLSKLSKLESLDMSGNNLEILTESLFKISNLSFVNVSRNNIKSIPSKTFDLNVIMLDVSYNDLTTIPIEWPIADRLTKTQVNAFGNPISTLDWHVEEGANTVDILSVVPQLDSFDQLQVLNLSGNAVFIWRSETGISTLRSLDISSGATFTVSSTVLCMSSMLEFFDISKSSFGLHDENFPNCSEFCEMNSPLTVQAHYMDHNPMNNAGFFDICNIAHLDFSGSPGVIEVPDDITRLSGLEYLGLRNCSSLIDIAGEKLSDMTSLKTIDLRDNSLFTSSYSEGVLPGFDCTTIPSFCQR